MAIVLGIGECKIFFHILYVNFMFVKAETLFTDLFCVPLQNGSQVPIGFLVPCFDKITILSCALLTTERRYSANVQCFCNVTASMLTFVFSVGYLCVYVRRS